MSKFLTQPELALVHEMIQKELHDQDILDALPFEINHPTLDKFKGDLARKETHDDFIVPDARRKNALARKYVSSDDEEYEFQDALDDDNEEIQKPFKSRVKSRRSRPRVDDEYTAKRPVILALEQRQTAYKMIKDGVSDLDLFDTFGFSATTLGRIKSEILHNNEVTTAGPVILKPAQRRQVREMIRENVPDGVIYEKYKISERALCRIKDGMPGASFSSKPYWSYAEASEYLNSVMDWNLTKGFPVTAPALRRNAFVWRDELNDPVMIEKYRNATFSENWFTRFYQQRRS